MAVRRALRFVLMWILSAWAAVSAGGWGVLTIRDLPDYVVAGQPFDLTISARSHGRVLTPGLSGFVEATAPSGRRARAAARPAADPGRYTATLVLPQPGEWRLTVQIGYGEAQALRLPLRAIAAGAPAPAAPPAADRGQRLFAAKGCITCHRHEAVESNHPAPVGPPLAGRIYTPEFLRWRLGPEAAASPRTPASPWTMPDLELSAAEVDALVAFMMRPAQLAER